MRIQFVIAALFFLSTAHAQTTAATFGIPLKKKTGQTTTDNKSIKPHLSSKLSKKEIAALNAANIKQAAKTQFTYFIIKGEANTYGYSIYADGNLYIYQSTIPGVTGTKGFNDTTSAASTAKLAIKKMKQGELPPTISINDLKKLGVLK